MHLVQLLLPLYHNDGRPQEKRNFALVREELTSRFGGLTAWTRAPAEGLWEEEPGERTRDDVVVHEVMVEELDADWWGAYRRTLEERFAQEAVVVRAIAIRPL